MEAVAIFGAPRSGTSWLGQIFNSSEHVAYRFQPLFSYEFKSRITERTTAIEYAQFFLDLFNTTNEFVLQKKMLNGKSGLEFDKQRITHLVWKEVRYHNLIESILNTSKCKVIGIVRHPCSVLSSWIRAPKEFDPKWNPLQEWRYAGKKNQDKPEEFYGYNKWKEIAFMYIYLERRFTEKFCILQYENLVMDTVSEVKRLFRFVGLPFTEQVESFIRLSKETEDNHPYSVFRNEININAWMGHLNDQISSAILADEDFKSLNEFFGWT